MKSSVVVANALAWLMACVAISEAADAPKDTVVSIKGMHCAACAKKVTAKLQSVPSVKSASVDPKKGIAVITPADSGQVSPKAVWEAVEKAGYKPTELKGPSGSFKKKPTE